MNKTSPTTRSATALRTLLVPLAFLATSASAEVTIHTSRPAFETALGDRPPLRDNFDSYYLQSSRLLDTAPIEAFGGAVVISAESSASTATHLREAGDIAGQYGIDSPSFWGKFILAGTHHSPSEADPAIGRGTLTFTLPQFPGQFPAFGFDFSGIAGWYGDPTTPAGRTLPLTYRVTTADGTQTTGILADANPVGAPHDDGFIGFTDPDSPIVSVELYNSLPYGHWTDNGDGEVYGIDNLIVSLLDDNADGIPDFYEQKHGLHDAEADPDHDGLPNSYEFENGTDPNNDDTDGDHLRDGERWSNPLDENSPHQLHLEVDYDHIDNNTEFAPRSLSALDSSVTVTPGWPNITSPEARLSSVNDNPKMALAPPESIEILRDFIGIDTHPSAGGNGSFDGENGTPTPMTITLQGVPKSSYRWLSYHHNAHRNNRLITPFTVEISTDAGLTYSAPRTFHMTQTPQRDETLSSSVVLPTATELMPSTVDLEFTATGDDVVVRFTPLSDGSPETRQLVINGLKVVPTSKRHPLEIIRLERDTILDEVSVTWNSRPGRPYSVESSNDMKSWQRTGPISSTSSETGTPGRSTTWTDSLQTTLPATRFYRVRFYSWPIGPK